MFYSVQNSRGVKVASVSLIMLLAACSSDSRYKRQVDGDESYLKAKPLAELHAPAGIALPPKSSDYALPVINGSGVVGKALDIRPPAQPLALVSGARTQFVGDTASLLVESPRTGSLWSQIVSVIQAQNYNIDKRDDASQSLITDWVQWNRADEDQQYRGRYQVSLNTQGYQQAVVVKLLNLEQNGKPVADAAAVQRYSAQMLNVISAGLDKKLAAGRASDNKCSGAGLDVQSGADNTGLPVLMVHGQFNVVWYRLPVALAKVGMKVTDTTSSKGNIAVAYKPLSESECKALGASNPELPAGNYKLQVGDLDNRSSLQFIDPKGHTLT